MTPDEKVRFEELLAACDRAETEAELSEARRGLIVLLGIERVEQ